MPKTQSGAITRHSGDGYNDTMPHNEALVGLTSDTSFEPMRESALHKFVERAVSEVQCYIF